MHIFFFVACKYIFSQNDMCQVFVKSFQLLTYPVIIPKVCIPMYLSTNISFLIACKICIPIPVLVFYIILTSIAFLFACKPVSLKKLCVVYCRNPWCTCFHSDALGHHRDPGVFRNPANPEWRL